MHWNPAVVHQAVGRAVRIGQRASVQIHCFRVVDAVCDNIDLRMSALHGLKIAGAREICDSLYEGFHSSSSVSLPSAPSSVSLPSVPSSVSPPSDDVSEDPTG